jgi:hypothetical protein
MKTLDKYLLVVTIFAILLGTVGTYLVWLNDPAIFCTKVKSVEYDAEDVGTHCFNTSTERNEFLIHLYEKYELNKTNTKDYAKNLNYSLNITIN